MTSINKFEQGAPAENPKLIPSSSSQKYAVFISHAGEDKETIAKPLRERLKLHGITAFVDESDMRIGTRAENAMIWAMENADIGVMILSPEFIARKWPVKEMMCFLRRRGERGTDDPEIPVIIPVFYRLSISELYDEPRFDRLDKNGNPLYHESRFFERMKKHEPEADIAKIKESLMKLRDTMGVENDMETTNESCPKMHRIRNMFIQHVCDKIRECVQTETVTGNTEATEGTRRSDNVFHTQALVDSFRECFPPLSGGVDAVLDFNRTDEDGNPTTTEGRVKAHLLRRSSDLQEAVSIVGLGGVGKSTILRALSVDEEVRQHFPDGVHIIELGMDSTEATLFEEICRVLKESGAKKTEESLRAGNDSKEALKSFKKWFDGKKCAFFIDDAWAHGISIKVLSSLCEIGSRRSENGVVVTTREREIALRVTKRCFKLKPREAKGKEALRILLHHANQEETDDRTLDKLLEGTASVDKAIQKILEICGGLPVSLAAAGKSVRNISFDMAPQKKDEAWRRFARELERCCESLLEEDVESYRNLFATLTTSLSFLEEKRQKGTLPFTLKLSFVVMYRRLCVVQKHAVVPPSMLMRLWGTKSEEEAEFIITTLVESGLASRESVRTEQRHVWHLRLHDSLHDFAVLEAKRSEDTANAHDSLLKGYSSCANRRDDAKGTCEWWSEELEVDGYIHEQVCRHLVEAGRAPEVVELLMCPEWTKRQLQVNGLFSLESDFSVGIHALRDGRIEASEDERFESEQVLQLVSEAAVLAWPYVSKNLAEIWFQLQGRLKGSMEKYKGIRDYVDRIEREGEGPLALCINSFLEAAGGANTRSFFLDTNVECMGVMHDGARIACGCSDGRILIVNAVRGEVEKEWKAHHDFVYSISVGRQSRLLASGAEDRFARVWNVDSNVDSGRCLTTFRGHTGSVNGVDVIEKTRRAVSVSSDGTAQIWDMETGAAVLPPLRGHGGRVYCVAVLNDGVHFVTGGDDNKLRLWNSSTGSQVGAPFEGHTAAVTSVAVTCDDKRIVSRSSDDTVRLWDAESHNQVGDPLLSEEVYYYRPSMVVSGDGSRIAAVDWDRRVHVWDSESKQRICDPLRLSKEHSKFQLISFLERDVIVSCSEDGIVKVWDLRRHKSGTVAVGHEDRVSTVSFTPDGDYVVSGSWDRTLQLWDSRTGNPVGDPLKEHSGRVNDVTVTPNGRYIVSVSYDKTVRVWNLHTRELLRTFTGHSESVSCVAVTPQGDKAVTGSNDQTLRVWDLEAMDGSVAILKGHETFVQRAFVTDDGLRIISVDDDDVIVKPPNQDVVNNVLVWDIETRRVVNRFKVSEAQYMSRREVFDRIGEKTVEDDATLSIPLYEKKIWYGDGEDKRVIATMESNIQSWALSPDQKTISVGMGNGQVGLLKLQRENSTGNKLIRIV